MEAWRRTWEQFQELFNGMAPSQRLTLVAVPLLVLAGLGLVMYVGVGPAEEPLLAGKTFAGDELKNAEDALRKAGMTGYRVEGGKIVVPKADASRYNSALITHQGLPDRFGEEMDRAYDKNPLLFSSDKQRVELVELAKSKELVKMIRAIPEVEDAGVVWQRSKGRGFYGDSKMTAMLGVRPKPGRELSGELVQSLRLAVAGAFGTNVDDVTVLNTRTGIAYQKDKSDPFGSEFVDTQRRFAAHHQRIVAEALQYIPNVLVSVNVELDNLAQSREQERKYDKSPFPFKSTEQTQTETANESRPSSEPGMTANAPRSVRPQATAQNNRTTEKNTTTSESVPVKTTVIDRVFAGLTPKSVQVAVAIPRDYYQQIAIKQGADAADKTALAAKVQQIETDIEKEVSQKVAKLIPPAATGTPADAINVSSYDRLETTEAPAAAPMTAQIGEIATQWGGPVGLAIFALWALWMLNRSMKRSAEEPIVASGTSAGKKSHSAAGPEAAEAAEEPSPDKPREPTKRDRLQVLVKDNPEMAASVISRWLAPPK